MSNYYYLMAQLPGFSISFGTPIQLPIQYDYFAELCSRFLNKKDLEILEQLTLEPPKTSIPVGSSFLNNWYDWERSLRIALAQIRSLRLKKEFSDTGMVVSPEIQQIARTASGMDSPLEAEAFLAAARIEAINRFSPMDIFTADALYAYAIKLQLAARIMKFNEEDGMASYRIIYDQILGESK